jgi:hypothetical protein
MSLINTKFSLSLSLSFSFRNLFLLSRTFLFIEFWYGLYDVLLVLLFIFCFDIFLIDAQTGKTSIYSNELMEASDVSVNVSMIGHFGVCFYFAYLVVGLEGDCYHQSTTMINNMCGNNHNEENSGLENRFQNLLCKLV